MLSNKRASVYGVFFGKRAKPSSPPTQSMDVVVAATAAAAAAAAAASSSSAAIVPITRPRVAAETMCRDEITLVFVFLTFHELGRDAVRVCRAWRDAAAVGGRRDERFVSCDRERLTSLSLAPHFARHVTHLFVSDVNQLTRRADEVTSCDRLVAFTHAHMVYLEFNSRSPHLATMDFAALRRMPLLRCLDLNGPFRQHTNGTWLYQLPQLTGLRVSKDRGHCAFMNQRLGSPDMTQQLTTLALGNIEDDDMLQLVQLPALTELRCESMDTTAASKLPRLLKLRVFVARHFGSPYTNCTPFLLFGMILPPQLQRLEVNVFQGPLRITNLAAVDRYDAIMHAHLAALIDRAAPSLVQWRVRRYASPTMKEIGFDLQKNGLRAHTDYTCDILGEPAVIQVNVAHLAGDETELSMRQQGVVIRRSTTGEAFLVRFDDNQISIDRQDANSLVQFEAVLAAKRKLQELKDAFDVAQQQAMSAITHETTALCATTKSAIVAAMSSSSSSSSVM